MGSKRNVSMSVTTDTVKKVSAEPADAQENQDQLVGNDSQKKVLRTSRAKRGSKYTAARSLVDKTKRYSIAEAIELVKKTAYAKFDATITADAVVKDIGDQGSVAFPHSTGKSIRVAIVNDDLIAQIEAGTIDFDVLLTNPSYMPKLAKFARTLGPKGLMPNPKNGTITQDPEAKKKELETGKTALKSEKKAPLLHVMVGKTSFESQQLVENVEALVTALDFRLKKLTLSAAMSPGITIKVG